MIRAAILGATGYTAYELIKLLLRHPHVEIRCLTSRQEDSPHVSTVHPSLTGLLDLRLTQPDVQQVVDLSDIVFSCLPHAASAESVAEILAASDRIKMVDFSADYRLTDLAVYEHWYGVTHPDPQRVGVTPYGLGEWFADSIQEARLVANPGCYPTSAILAIGPLLKAGIASPQDIVIDSKSGVSGAGRSPKLTTLFPECNESFSAYGVGQHRHTPEIEQVLSTLAGENVDLIFTPHLVPMDRGILTTAYVRPKGSVTQEAVMAELRKAYEGSPFVQVVDHLPATKHVSGTNFCHLTARIVNQRIVLISCIDNLIKGASGAAVQNMNLMFGWDMTLGLL
ncbi:MAG: N-acetyl-gamma-glutamyl-phosphate reductase [Planctomycetales bacterium]|nr:N-acetyl-gamma-glutamyl-phosphate reductase [Planctomycetales bacterium]